MNVKTPSLPSRRGRSMPMQSWRSKTEKRLLWRNAPIHFQMVPKKQMRKFSTKWERISLIFVKLVSSFLTSGSYEEQDPQKMLWDTFIGKLVYWLFEARHKLKSNACNNWAMWYPQAKSPLGLQFLYFQQGIKIFIPFLYYISYKNDDTFEIKFRQISVVLRPSSVERRIHLKLHLNLKYNATQR